MYFSFDCMTSDDKRPGRMLWTKKKEMRIELLPKPPPKHIKKRLGEKKIDGDNYYLPLAKDFSTPIMEAGIAMATNAKAKLGSSSMRLYNLI
jgi:hypothetical protein